MPGWNHKPPAGTQLDLLDPLNAISAGCWLFNEGGGLLARDIAGSRRNGVLTSGPVWSSEGITFDGVNDQIVAPAVAISGTQAFSMAIWVRTTQVIAMSTTAGLLMTQESGTPGTNDKGFQAVFGGQVSFYAYDGAVRKALGTTNIFDGRLRCLVGTYDGTNLRIYIDGVLEGTQACSSTFAFTTPQWVFSHISSPQVAYAGVTLAGRVWKRCLTPGEAGRLSQDRWAGLLPPTPMRLKSPAAAFLSRPNPRLNQAVMHASSW